MTPIRASTQFFLQIEDIKDDLVVLKDGSVACVLETTAVNFGLLSKDEQEAVVYAFAAFLNSLSFPIQINIVSKKVDISEYLELIKKQEATQKSVKLREKISSYYRFIISLIKENRVWVIHQYKKDRGCGFGESVPCYCFSFPECRSKKRRSVVLDRAGRFH